MRVAVVDERDRVIGRRERDALGRNEIYRVSALWLTNDAGEILLTRRAMTKRQGAGMWGPAVTGTVEWGESYQDNISREISEELGIAELPSCAGLKELVERDERYFLQWFLARVHGRPMLRLRVEEVAGAQWFSERQLRLALQVAPNCFISAVGRFMARLVPVVVPLDDGGGW